MKKLICMILALVLVFALAACGDNSSNNNNAGTPNTNDTPANNDPSGGNDTPPADGANGGEGDGPAAADYSQYMIGIIQPGPENYYQTFTDRIVAAAELAGFQTQTLLSQYDPSADLSNTEDLISAGVDAIVIFAVNSDSAQQVTQICNDANMPVFLVTTENGAGPGVPTASIGNSFYDMGYANGEWLIAHLDEVGGTANVLELQGQLGTGIGDEITRGFEAATANNANINIVYQQDCVWDRAQAISALEDQISAGTDFNVVFVHNEDMCGGVVSVLEENGMLDDILVMTQNGSDDGFAMLDAKQIAMTVTNSPSLVGGETVVALMKYFDGTLEANADIDAAVYAVDQTNYSDPNTVTWDLSWAESLVSAYLSSK